jgi:hypothetical protein
MVTVNVPEQVPTVNVSVPPPRRTVKSITYDQYGRPEVVEEREVD